MSQILLAASLQFFVALFATDAPPAAEFRPGKVWLDTAGAPINAHGGGMLRHGDTYYWYGESKEGRTPLPDENRSWGGRRVDVSGIRCFSSKDLFTWKDEGLALRAVPSKLEGGAMQLVWMPEWDLSVFGGPAAPSVTQASSPGAEPGVGEIRRDGNKWILTTKAVERTVAFDAGRLILESLKDKATGRELVPPGVRSGEFSVSLGDASSRLSGAEGAWSLVDAAQRALPQGETQLDITLRRDSLTVVKSYVVYPGSSIIREWVTFANSGSSPLKVIDPGFLELAVQPGEPAATDFLWMTGGENRPGSWVLKSESLSAGTPRRFDSYDPFPLPPGEAQCPGDGIDAKILLNDRQVWPAEGWQYSAHAGVSVPFEVAAKIEIGDRLVFLVNQHGNYGWDTTAFDPTIVYDDGETHSASKEFDDRQGLNGWQYQYVQDGKFVDLVYYAAPRQWRKAQDNPTGTPFVGAGAQHPHDGQDAARVWTAPKAGTVRIAGSICNSGNVSTAGPAGFRMGTSTYAPWNALYARDTRQGLCIGWDYFGHWASSFEQEAGGAVRVRFRVAGHAQTLAPGQSLTTPKAFVGLFRDDLDNAGNEVLAWQYRYLWDYTRAGWFPAIRALGYWMRGTGWGQPGIGWTGGAPDTESTFRKVFRVADLMRSIGADVYHRDWGWWDRAGDWNGPDFRTTASYLRKHGMGQLIYAFLYTVDGASRVVREHPEWVLGGGTLDMSQPPVVDFMLSQLDGFVARWGDFEWRNDSVPTCPRDGNDTPLLGQDAGLREVIRRFLDKYPGCAFQAVNGGGNCTGYDYARYASTVSFSDGAVGIMRNYWAALVLPPDKTSDIPDVWDPDKYDKATWRGLLCINFDMTGDTWDRAKLEGLRELVDIYHYLFAQGVVGRWVQVYRPRIAGDDPTMYFQRLSGDARRGVIIIKRPAPGAVTITPKGLLPAEKYLITFHESPERAERTGADLMEKGIAIAKMAPGELIYLNLPLHPGNKLDRTAPTPPRDPVTRRAEYMGFPGVELVWTAGSDDNWVSYYEVLRDGTPIDKVAKGTFYFDHSAGADPSAAYAVRTVDGAGNVSEAVTAASAKAQRARIIDDAADGGIVFTGEWERRRDLQPAHAGTISSSAKKGAAAQATIEGRRILWFSKLGPDCGKAAVSVDGGPAEIVDTYCADDIWGVCAWRKELPAAGTHTVSIVVLDERNARASAARVHVDGVRGESTYPITASSGINEAIGVGGGAGSGSAGAFNVRLGILQEGGSKATEEAVRAALEWLRRHQNEDGSWSCNDFMARCDKGHGPCKNLPDNVDPAGSDGRGWKEHDIGVTALAMLAFTGYGHTHRVGTFPEYVEVLKKACDFMKSVQIKGTGDPNYDGCFRRAESIPKDKSKEAEDDEDTQWMYDHAIATMAMADLLASSGDKLLLTRTVEDAAMFCIRAQNNGWGWRYNVKLGDNDTSVTGWMMLALKTVAACRSRGYVSAPSERELQSSFKGALNWFAHATSSTTGWTGYKSPGDEGSRLAEFAKVKGGYPFSKEQSCMTAVSVLCRLLAGSSRSDETIKKGVVHVLMEHPPKWQKPEGKAKGTINFYYWYYGAHAMFQYGGGMWREWNEKLKEALVPTQRMYDEPKGRTCEDGSWDPIDEWSFAGGRVYTTAMGALTLEVYYRYERAKEARKK